MSNVINLDDYRKKSGQPPMWINKVSGGRLLGDLLINTEFLVYMTINSHEAELYAALVRIHDDDEDSAYIAIFESEERNGIYMCDCVVEERTPCGWDTHNFPSIEDQHYFFIDLIKPNYGDQSRFETCRVCVGACNDF